MNKRQPKHSINSIYHNDNLAPIVEASTSSQYTQINILPNPQSQSKEFLSSTFWKTNMTYSYRIDQLTYIVQWDMRLWVMGSGNISINKRMVLDLGHI